MKTNTSLSSKTIQIFKINLTTDISMTVVYEIKKKTYFDSYDNLLLHYQE